MKLTNKGKNSLAQTGLEHFHMIRKKVSNSNFHAIFDCFVPCHAKNIDDPTFSKEKQALSAIKLTHRACGDKCHTQTSLNAAETSKE